jgi:putative transposase
MSDQQAFEAIVHVLRTGIQWSVLPQELGASSTVHDRFQAWERAGVFKVLWQTGLQKYDEVQGIQ